jgi:hypothetical protein
MTTASKQRVRIIRLCAVCMGDIGPPSNESECEVGGKCAYSDGDEIKDIIQRPYNHGAASYYQYPNVVCHENKSRSSYNPHFLCS